jgi:hypothetical protein
MLLTSYTRNLLNQYLERTVPGGFDVIGLADAGATVTINGSSSGVYRKDAYFRKELTVNNSISMTLVAKFRVSSARLARWQKCVTIAE